MRLTNGVVCVALCSVACGTREQSLETQTGALAAYDDTVKFARDGSGYAHVPVCFQVAPGATMPAVGTRAIIQNAIERSWNVASWVKFEGFLPCPPPNANCGADKYVVIELVPGDNGQNHARGTNALHCSGTNTFFMGVNANRQRLEYQAVHEMGHVLGFGHEQDRRVNGVPENDAGAYDQHLTLNQTVFDPDSIMNYSNYDGNQTGRLSELDIQGVQNFYGPNPSNDDDLDGIVDAQDNCPYAANRDQADTNFDAEREVQKLLNPAIDGHVPKLTNPNKDSQAYIDQWHSAYKGDACDPTPTTHAEFGTTPANASGDTCTTNALTMQTTGLVKFYGYRGSPTGTILKTAADDVRADGAICRCDSATGSPNDVASCALSATWVCKVAWSDPVLVDTVARPLRPVS